jgi:hypothetical protein
MFFWNERAPDSANFIDIEEKKKVYKPARWPESRGYFGTKRVAKHLVPAGIQREASALILFTIEGNDDSLWSKIRLFLSSRISYHAKRAMECDPLQGGGGVTRDRNDDYPPFAC